MMFFHRLFRTSLYWEEENMRLALMQSRGEFDVVAKREEYPTDRGDPLEEFARLANMNFWYRIWLRDTTSTGPAQITTETSM